MPTSYARSENVQVIIGRESAFGVGDTGTPVGHKLMLAAVTGGRTQEWEASPILRGDPFEGDPIFGMNRCALTLRAAVTIRTLPLILKGIGALATTGTGDPYTHTAKGSATRGDSFWIERWNADRARGDRFYGCRPAGFKLSIGNKGPQPLLLEIPIVGSGDPSTSNRSQSTRVDATPDTYDTDVVHTLKDCTLAVGGATTAIIEQFDLNLAFNMTPFDPLDGASVSDDILEDAYIVTGKLTGIFDQADTIRGYASETVSRALLLTSPTPGDTVHPITFSVPRAFCAVSADPDHSGRGPVRASVEFKGVYDSTNLSSWVIAVLNAVSNYTTW